MRFSRKLQKLLSPDSFASAFEHLSRATHPVNKRRILDDIDWLQFKNLRHQYPYPPGSPQINRFEDVGFMGGGTIGRNLYWRLQGTTGNPLYFRDPNALAGDNGIRELLQPNPDPRLKSGFPILYNAETEGYSVRSDHVQFGQGIGYRWQNDAQTFGFDAIAFHYRRSMADREQLTGTFYGGDLDLLNGPEGFNISLPINGRRKTGLISGGVHAPRAHRICHRVCFGRHVGGGARIVLSPSAFRQSTGRCGRRRDRRTSAAVRRPFLIFSLIQRRGMQCWCGSDTLVRGI